MKMLDALDDTSLTELRAQDEFFWLDLTGPTQADIERLGKDLGLHQLSIEDTVTFGQRPKLDVYDSYALLVMHGAVEYVPEDDNANPLEEIHTYVSGDFIVTIHRNPFADLEQLKKELQQHPSGQSDQYYVYKVVDVIVDSYFAVLSDLDEEINQLEDSIADHATKSDLQRIYRLKNLLLKLRRVVLPMRDVFARQIEVIADIAGLSADSHDYFRDVYDHLLRITDQLDAYHDLVSGCRDLYMSVIANRQGEIGKQLSIIASIFLPLSFLTGFFGMNFTAEADTILDGAAWFVGLGIGLMLLSAGFTWWWFHRKGWTRSDD